MNRLIIDLAAIEHNIAVIDGWMKDHGARWTLVTKSLCGHADTLRALQRIGVRSIADSRLENLREIARIAGDVESWYLRPPHPSACDSVVRLAGVSLNTELDVVAGLNEAAKKQGRVHRIVIMIELGDLREGVLPADLEQFYERTFALDNVHVLGIGANLGCLSGAVPNIDQLTQLVIYQELLELKYDRPLPIISGGSSSLLPLLLAGRLPREINHFRIGEAVFLGTDLVNGGTLAGLRDDGFTLEAEIIEIKEKSLIPLGETGTTTPFAKMEEGEHTPGARGYRALVALGQLDAEMGGLTPLNPDHAIAGASSDVSVINLGDSRDRLQVGDSIRFRPSYGALVRLMTGRYLEKVVTPELDEYEVRAKVELPPVAPEPEDGQPG